MRYRIENLLVHGDHLAGWLDEISAG